MIDVSRVGEVATEKVVNTEVAKQTIRQGMSDVKKVSKSAMILHIARIIWVDAVCINQEDKQEKEHQVQYIAKIYGKASYVIVWHKGGRTIAM